MTRKNPALEELKLYDEKVIKNEQKRIKTFAERVKDANLFLNDGCVFLKPSQIGRENESTATEKTINVNGFNVVISERIKEEKIKHNPNMDLSLYKNVLSEIADGETATLYKQFLLSKGKRTAKKELQ